MAKKYVMTAKRRAAIKKLVAWNKKHRRKSRK